MRRLLPFLVLVLSACGAGRDSSLAIGSPAPEFTLPGIDGKSHTLSEYSAAPVLAMVFTCNHCPASQMYESRIRKLYEDYSGKGVAVVAINPDNPASLGFSDLGYTDVGDSLAEMKVRASFRHLPYPYLYDGETQALSRKIGLSAVPQIFVFDRQRTLQYEGRIDDNLREDLAGAHDARDAIEALLAGRRVARARTTAVGCAPRWVTEPSARTAELATIESEPVAVEPAGTDALSKLRGNATGRLLLVNFWATWCAPCITEFPELEATYRMYRGRNLHLVTVSINDPEEKGMVLAFLQKHHASSANLQFGTSDTSGLQAAFDPLMPAAVPFTLLIAPGGDVLYQELGELDMLKLRRAILANLPDDPEHAGQQAYWSGH
jgi:thiol-disulfide isomerase/thioredoxin